MSDIYSFVPEGLFLLFLAVNASSLLKVMPCNIQPILENNIFLKWIFIFSIVYFTVKITSNQQEHSPSEHLIISILSFVMFIMISNMNTFIITIVVGLLVIIYLLFGEIEYRKMNKPNEVKSYEWLFHITSHILTFVIVFGFLHYLYYEFPKQKDNVIKFIFSMSTCESGHP